MLIMAKPKANNNNNNNNNNNMSSEDETFGLIVLPPDKELVLNKSTIESLFDFIPSSPVSHLTELLDSINIKENEVSELEICDDDDDDAEEVEEEVEEKEKDYSDKNERKKVNFTLMSGKKEKKDENKKRKMKKKRKRGLIENLHQEEEYKIEPDVRKIQIEKETKYNLQQEKNISPIREKSGTGMDRASGGIERGGRSRGGGGGGRGGAPSATAPSSQRRNFSSKPTTSPSPTPPPTPSFLQSIFAPLKQTFQPTFQPTSPPTPQATLQPTPPPTPPPTLPPPIQPTPPPPSQSYSANFNFGSSKRREDLLSFDDPFQESKDAGRQQQLQRPPHTQSTPSADQFRDQLLPQSNTIKPRVQSSSHSIQPSQPPHQPYQHPSQPPYQPYQPPHRRDISSQLPQSIAPTISSISCEFNQRIPQQQISSECSSSSSSRSSSEFSYVMKVKKETQFDNNILDVNLNNNLMDESGSKSLPITPIGAPLSCKWNEQFQRFMSQFLKINRLFTLFILLFQFRIITIIIIIIISCNYIYYYLLVIIII